MKHLTIILLVILLYSCGGTQSATATEIDPKLAPYVQMFGLIGQINIPPLTVVFKDIKDEGYEPGSRVIGYCYLQLRRIEIDPTWWAGASPLAQQAIMFHELGHCVLGRDEMPVVDPDGCSRSIMHPMINKVLQCYDKKMNYYHQELFK